MYNNKHNNRVMADAAAIIEHELLPTRVDKELTDSQNHWLTEVRRTNLQGQWETLGLGYAEITKHVRLPLDSIERSLLASGAIRRKETVSGVLDSAGWGDVLVRAG